MTLQRLAPERAAAGASLEHAQVQVTTTALLLDQRRVTEGEKARARAQLLDGAATASHRTRINEACRITREALVLARETKSATDAAFQAAGARCDEAAAGLETAKGRSALAEEAFNAACLDTAQRLRVRLYLRGNKPPVASEWEANIAGLDLSASAAIHSDLKTFILQYRDADGRTRRIKLGRFGAIIHIDEALKLATARTCEEIASLLDEGESAKATASPKKAA